jgi:hypothetical protein
VEGGQRGSVVGTICRLVRRWVLVLTFPDTNISVDPTLSVCAWITACGSNNSKDRKTKKSHVTLNPKVFHFQKPG